MYSRREREDEETGRAISKNYKGETFKLIKRGPQAQEMTTRYTIDIMYKKPSLYKGPLTKN